MNFIQKLLKKITGKNRYHYLTKYIIEYKCKNIIEVGVWNGKNSRKMLEAAMFYEKLSSNINFWGFDLWEEMDDKTFKQEYSKKPPKISYVKKYLKATGCNIHLLQGDTKRTLREFYNDNIDKINVDFIYIDGGHSFETIESDWKNLNAFMNKKTLTIFDDYYIYESADPDMGVGDNLKPTFGCSKLIDSLDRNIWDIKILPYYDQFGSRKIHFALVTKK